MTDRYPGGDGKSPPSFNMSVAKLAGFSEPARVLRFSGASHPYFTRNQHDRSLTPGHAG
ncbi:MAG: hypothetical protein JZU65_07165 [Chlorobium sp.]|nr:hypothetical protein [Chlorobium sp.]